MLRRIIFPCVFSFFLFVLSLASCTKLDTTSLGGDLIPEVDNVNTFADTLDVITAQNAFEGIYKDTTKLTLLDKYVVGKIADPTAFGNTDASLYLQLKPSFFPYYIGVTPKDSIVNADSVVLCLSYNSFWGDSSTPLNLQVFEIPGNAGGEWDSLNTLRDINYSPTIGSAISDVKAVDIRNLGNYVKVGIADSTTNQIRIKLSDEFKNRLFSRDTISTSSQNAFLSDSLFKLFNKGFAIVANNGNALVYTDINNANTRLELHYKKKSRTSNDTGYSSSIDTVYSSFYFNAGYQGGNVKRSSVANKIARSRNSLPSGDQELYLQTTPGTFATLRIPKLDTMKNVIVHRAEIQIQQIPDLSTDKIFTEPAFLYLDLVDSGTNKWKPIYYDLNPSLSYDPDYKTAGYPYFPINGEVNIEYFGGNLRKKFSLMGEQSYYTINITRHVQQILTKHTPNYQMRLFPAHSFSYPQYGSTVIPYLNPIAKGRVKVGGGANPNPAYRMRVRIVYSKTKIK